LSHSASPEHAFWNKKSITIFFKAKGPHACLPGWQDVAREMKLHRTCGKPPGNEWVLATRKGERKAGWVHGAQPEETKSHRNQLGLGQSHKGLLLPRPSRQPPAPLQSPFKILLRFQYPSLSPIPMAPPGTLMMFTLLAGWLAATPALCYNTVSIWRCQQPSAYLHWLNFWPRH
jgi:hypothetical protein